MELHRRGASNMGSDPLIGQVLHDTYRITARVAEGGMGAIYTAEHARLSNKRYAVKMLHNSARSPEIFHRFRREAEIASALGHPNIVDVLDFYQTDDGQPYMIMEYLEGEDLGARIQRRGQIPPAELIQIMDQVGAALEVAHDGGIVHRDMKPENIFLATAGAGAPTVKVLDFGISKIRHSTTLLTMDQAVFGTPFYMSPEQARGEVKTIDHTTDIFAVAVICYHALSGQLPFQGDTPLAIIRNVCDTEPPPITDHMPGLPHVVQDVLARGMAKEKEARYPRVMDLVGDLRGALSKDVGYARTLPSGGAAAATLPAPAEVVSAAPAARPPELADTALAVASTTGEAPAVTTMSASTGEREHLPLAGTRQPPAAPRRRGLLVAGWIVAAACGFVLAYYFLYVDRRQEGPHEPVVSAQPGTEEPEEADEEEEAERTPAKEEEPPRTEAPPAPVVKKKKPRPVVKKKPRPVVKVARKRSPKTISAAEMKAVQRKHKGALEACYQRAAKRDDTIPTRLEIKATIEVSAKGHVQAMDISDVPSDELERCLANVMARWVFRPGGARSVIVPLSFARDKPRRTRGQKALGKGKHPTFTPTYRMISSAEINRLIAGNRKNLKACHDRALKRDETLTEVKAEVVLNVSDMGRIKKVRIGSVPSKPLKTCLKRVIKRWVFKPCGAQSIKFPIIFRGS